MSQKKIGRNAPCPCGSGRKYKICHGKTTKITKEGTPLLIQKTLEHLKDSRIRELQRESMFVKEYGYVRPPIAVDFNGHKVVAVGNKLHISKESKTLPDFLMEYIIQVLDINWWKNELGKEFNERHQILKWSERARCIYMENKQREDKLHEVIAYGELLAYLSIAYDLYTLDHHTVLQKYLVNRLKHHDQFQGARYELFVASTCIRAGFEIEHEDETDVTRKHPEFTATHKATKQIISVEAKSRHRPGIAGFKGERETGSEILRGA